MLKRALTWLRDREPVATVAGVVAFAGTVIGPAVADLPPEASWTAVGSAVLFAGVRWFVSSRHTTGET
jgi:hypothetical protein